MLKTRSRELRKNLTDVEKRLWNHLRLRQIGGYKFRRQHPIGSYIVDFVCLEKRLIVEVDGSQHFEQSSYDSKRDAWLNSQGFRVLRFWDNEIFYELEAVKEVIFEKLNEQIPPPSPSPSEGGGKGGGDDFP